MSTLLIRLAAPIQSWGVDSKFEERRTTMREPTKSGVVGMLAAALGRRRDDLIDDLSELRFGVRVDQPGQLLRDYHTAKSNDGKLAYVTHRYYLADAVFVVGLEGDNALLRMLDEALCSPVFPLYLGRRSCPPTGRISLGVSEESLEQALQTASWQVNSIYRKKVFSHSEHNGLTVIIDDLNVGSNRQRDVPLSFSQKHRRHMYRYLVDKPNSVIIQNTHETEHDAFGAIEEEA